MAMKRVPIIIGGAGVILLAIALFEGVTQSQSQERTKELIIVTHALTEWRLARQAKLRIQLNVGASND